MKKLPAEVVASLLAITTVPIAAHASHLPPWAIFISWAATFAMGGPTPENLKKIWPTLPVGSLFAFVIVLCFRQAAEQFSGPALIVAEMVMLFLLNAGMMFLARAFYTLRFIPGMFFGFASYFATLFGGFGPTPGDPVAALGAVVAMNAMGPAYAWIKARYSAPESLVERPWQAHKREA
ncbi:DUF1097 domain-containing protein [Cupriavidus consociatus]|uniref:DUF1097 domain-containing protein n=1 Tax=Cupriavidus consociatus TaxID=2821357 RepID=UPI001AEA73FE|nr:MULTISPECIES: DUF1097 domain-containing protein [unclassified Cupriavidus]MBP0620634.1 DUF1097 domain-containing protein [Cupriavidus sp. LEh25]MDK2657294.1 DUF1097 domain-containing protein [Cupriavidus sp. LEh21]